MTDTKYDILGDVLPAIDPARLSYQQWVDVGFALKDGGFAWQDWDAWSRRDPSRYHAGECEKKWRSIQSSGIALGTLIQYAREQGWTPAAVRSREDRAYDWDDTIGAHGDLTIVENASQIEAHPLPEPAEWHPGRELTRYLELLFGPDEIVGYVTSVWFSADKQKYMPDKGIYSRTAGELIADIARHGDDLGAVIGDAKPEAGAWIRFNPLDGNGIRNENVTEYRYALVESDSMSVEQQYALYRELELPARVLVHSGGKSLHAIVHIGASNYSEYRERVAYLYKVCEANGLKVDGQNKNPSRLSRMPGIMRGEKRQYIVAENIGRESFEAWKEYIESIHDDLPDPVSLSDVWDDLPALSPPLIEGVLRQGHKLLLSGPSKAGKSFALLELCIAIAEGRSWLGFPCARGRVLYVNLELDPNSLWHRLKDVYAALKIPAEHIANIDVWNLRGAAIPLDKLAPKLIRRAQKKNYIAVVVDPIYKVITGDENSADQMARFCNQFDLICARLGCAVIYCHHHSKGMQGGKKSMDRASGSGVFARDPDALLDMIELPVTDALRDYEANRVTVEACKEALFAWTPNWEQLVSQDDLCSAPRMLEICRQRFPDRNFARLQLAIQVRQTETAKRTAWRIEGTLREFERFPPVNLWFNYPIHNIDQRGILADVRLEEDMTPRKRGRQRLQENNRKQRDSVLIDIRNAVDFSPTGSVAIRDLNILNKNGNPYDADKISGWFGDGATARPACKREFEKFIGDDGRAYLRRRSDTGSTPG